MYAKRAIWEYKWHKLLASIRTHMNKNHTLTHTEGEREEKQNQTKPTKQTQGRFYILIPSLLVSPYMGIIESKHSRPSDNSGDSPALIRQHDKGVLFSASPSLC